LGVFFVAFSQGLLAVGFGIAVGGTVPILALNLLGVLFIFYWIDAS